MGFLDLRTADADGLDEYSYEPNDDANHSRRYEYKYAETDNSVDIGAFLNMHTEDGWQVIDSHTEIMSGTTGIRCFILERPVDPDGR